MGVRILFASKKAEKHSILASQRGGGQGPPLARFYKLSRWLNFYVMELLSFPLPLQTMLKNEKLFIYMNIK